MSVAYFPSSRIHHHSGARLIIAAALFMISSSAQADPSILPDPTLPPSGNPLCTSNAIECLDVDDFAGHIGGHLQILPASAHRGTAAIFPFGIAMGVFGRVVGSISSQYAFWNANGTDYHQFGPIRLSLTGRLWPLSPFFTSGGTSEGAEEGEPHYVPPRGLRLGLSFEQEIRTSVFDGANALEMLNNLALMRLIGSKALGLLEFSGSLGVLYDWSGQFATGEIAAQVSLFLPFFKALRVYFNGLGRGVPAYVKKAVLLPALDPTEPIKRQAMFGGGVAYQPHARVDLGVSAEAGVGGLAPWTITAQLFYWSLGHTYQGREGTPVGQIAVDVGREFVSWAVEKAKSIDPYLRNNCILYDDNHAPMGKLGELAPDGKACIYQGLRVPIDQHFWRNRGETRVCYDEKLTDCFLTRADRDSPWEPIHPMLVNTDCFAYRNGQPWMRTGNPTPDKQGCEVDGHVIPIGQTLKPNHSHPGYYCYDEPNKIKHQTEKLWCLEAPPQPQSDAQYVGRRFAAGIDREQDSLEKDSQKVHQVIDEGAQGVPLHATTPVKEAEAEGRQAIDKIKNATLDDGEKAFYGAIDAAKKWLGKPTREKLGDVAEDAGETMASPTTWAAGAGAAFGRGGRALSAGADLLGGTEKLGQEAKKVGKGVKKARTAVALEDEAVHTAPSALPKRTLRDAERPASSAVQKSQYGEHLRQAEEYGPPRELPDGRIRYYGSAKPSNKPGEMAGLRKVREWDPATNKYRTWFETVDHDGKIRQVRPEEKRTGGKKVHFTFSPDGKYQGKW